MVRLPKAANWIERGSREVHRRWREVERTAARHAHSSHASDNESRTTVLTDWAASYGVKLRGEKRREAKRAGRRLAGAQHTHLLLFPQLSLSRSLSRGRGLLSGVEGGSRGLRRHRGGGREHVVLEVRVAAPVVERHDTMRAPSRRGKASSFKTTLPAGA